MISVFEKNDYLFKGNDEVIKMLFIVMDVNKDFVVDLSDFKKYVFNVEF